MNKIVVGLWSRDTKVKRDLSSDTLSALRKAIFTTQVRAEMTHGTGTLKSIFVAPEFLFTQPRLGHSGTTAMDTESRDWLLDQIKQMVRGCHGMLLIPGTFVYKKPVTARSAKHARERLTHARDQEKKGLKKGAPASPKPYPTYETVEYDSEGYKDYYTQQLARVGELETGEKNAIVTNPLIAGQSFFIRNKTYVFFDGEIKFRYGKKTNMDDFHDDVVKGIFVPGTNEGLTTIAELKVGFEICMDHSEGLLKSHLNKADLDLHIITSAEVPNKTAFFCAKNNGFVIHACSEPDHTGVFKKITGKGQSPILLYQDLEGRSPEQAAQKATGQLLSVDKTGYNARVEVNVQGWENIVPTRTLEIGGGPLRIYEIDL